jgi:two-component system response regulator CpxR
VNEWPTEEVLLIDDDVELCSMLQSYLVKHGFRVTVIHNGKSGLEAAQSRPNAIILLDVMLPDLDGFEVLRRLRSSSAIRVLLLSARGDDVDRIVGLEIGADDYLTKPFNPRELVARIRAVLRRTSRADAALDGRNAPPKTVRVGGVELDAAARTVAADGGQTVELTGVEFALLEILMRSPGEVIAREHLTESVLGRKFYQFDRSLDMHVCRLRRKLDQLSGLEDRVKLGEQVKTIRGLGYQFVVPRRSEP